MALKIIFLFKPYSTGIISYLNSKTKAEIFVPEKEEGFPELSTERSVFTTYYDLLKKSSDVEFKNFTALYRKLKKGFPDCDYAQLVFCTVVFEEVGIISLQSSPLRIIVNKVKADLNRSDLYTRVKEVNDRA